MKEYWLEVFTPFLEAYRSCTHTPNPDVLCNQAIKVSGGAWVGGWVVAVAVAVAVAV